MVSIYGAHVDVQGPPVLCLSLAVVLCYRRWIDGGRIGPVLILSLLASAFDWYGLYAPAACALHLFITRPSRRRSAVLLGAWTGLLWLGWVTWLVTLPTMSWQRLRAAAVVRGPSMILEQGEQAVAGIGVWWSEVGELMPLWAVWLAVSFIMLIGGGAPREDPAAPERRLGSRGLLALLLFPPLLHGLLFPSGLLQHSYWLFGLPCGLAVGAAWLARKAWNGFRPGVTVLLFAALIITGLSQADRLLDPGRADEVPALIGLVNVSLYFQKRYFAKA
jgi:hypothetical protein